MSIARARHLRSNLTPQEAKLWIRLRALRAIGVHFRRQVPIEGYYLDFACLKHRLAIEIDGSQHAHPKGIAHDTKRDVRLIEVGFRMLRFWNADIDANIGGVVECILMAVDLQLVEDLPLD